MNVKSDSAKVTVEELLRRVREYGPRWRDRAEQTDRLRNLPDETVAELHKIGVLKQFQPTKYGGFAHDWGDLLKVGAEIARYCPSTAWIHSVVGMHTWMAGRFGHEAQEEIFADPDVLIATAFAGGHNIQANVVDGGYRVTGQWKYSSGVNHSQWAIVAAQPETSTIEEHDFTLLAVPKGDFTYNDSWHTTGLRGTGSNDIILKDVFVPKHRTTRMTSFNNYISPEDNPHPEYIYHVEVSPYFGTNIIAPALGCAKGAFETYVELTKGRVGQLFGEKISTQVPVQVRIGTSAAEIRAAEEIINRVIRYLHKAGIEGRRVHKSERVELRGDTTLAANLLMSSVERLIKMMGAKGLTFDNPVQRYYNDLRAIVAHQIFQWDHGMAPYGQWALGLPIADAGMESAPDGRKTLFET